MAHVSRTLGKPAAVRLATSCLYSWRRAKATTSFDGSSSTGTHVVQLTSGTFCSDSLTGDGAKSPVS